MKAKNIRSIYAFIALVAGVITTLSSAGVFASPTVTNAEIKRLTLLEKKKKL